MRGARAAAFSDARKNVRALALEELASRDRELLQELLTGFASAYAAAKDRESALDFEDLQLRALKLLEEHEAIREVEQLRFRSIMVDEFQDTNRLQTELIDLLCAGPPKELFFVGDEFQSIYGFRHADVAVFRERREAAPQVLPLTLNYRSRPEVLAAVNELFADEFGDELPGAHPGGRLRRRRSFGTPVELLVTDKASYADSGLHWRRAEARHVARRVRELVDAGAATPGEIVLLFAAGTDAEWFEEELRALDLPTIRMTGRRYFGQQQVVDLLSLPAAAAEPLRRRGAAHRPRLAVRRRLERRARPHPLDAPSGGRSSRASSARCRPISPRTTGASCAPSCSATSASSRARRGSRWSCSASASSSSTTTTSPCWRDATAQRRYANLRKLARLARSYEELRGPDIEGFIRFVAEQDAVGAPERDAVSEEEGADAVRLLTIHAAKGLEFKVVVVADAGRERSRTRRDPLPLGRPLRVQGRPPGHRPRASSTTSYQDVKETQDRAEEAERLRLYYVAMTRAMERLIVSGSVDRSSERDEQTPIGWVLQRLALGEELDRADAAGPVEVERGNAGVVLRIDRFAPAAACRRRRSRPRRDEPERRGGPARALRGRGRGDPGGRAAAARARRDSRAAARPGRAPLLQRDRAPRPLRLPLLRRARRRHAARSRGSRARTANGAGGLHPTEIGDAVHRLLELVDLAAPAAPDEAELEAARARAGIRPSPTTSWRGSASSCGRTRGSALAARIAGLSGVRPERPFAFELDGVLVNGRLDVLWLEGDRALVLDYKTNALLGRDPAEIVEEEYLTQQIVYAIACLRAGAPRGRGRLPLPRGRRRRRLEGLHGRRRGAPRGGPARRSIARIRAGEFRPTPSAFACSGCPALDVVCAGPRLGGGAERARAAPSAFAELAGSRRPVATSREARRRGLGTRRERIGPIVERLAEEHADAEIALRFGSDVELLISVMLSAQTTDVNVNRVTEKLFVKYRRPEDYLAVPQEELEQDVFQTGFYRQKAKSIRGAMRVLLEEFDGEVPRTIPELLRLPGVARKTANVVAAELGEAQGIVVDTHVRRISQRLGLTREEDPVKIERDLVKIVPRADWHRFPHLLIWHGRRVCDARKPRCGECVLADLCPSSPAAETEGPRG